MIKSELFWNIFIFVSFSIEWFMCKKFLDYSNKPKSNNTRITLMIIVVIFFANILSFLNVFPNTRVLISIFITIIIAKLGYDIKLMKAICISIIYWMLLICIDALSMSLTIWINLINDMSNLLANNIYRVESISIGKILLIAVLYLYKSYFYETDSDIDRRIFTYMSIPIFTNIVLFFIIFKYIFKYSKETLIDRNQLFMIAIVLLLSNISLILLIKKIHIDNKFLMENNMLEKISSMKNEYYKNIESKQLKIELLSHDMKNHILCIEGMYENNIDIRPYLHSIKDKIKNNNIYYTGNITLDIILNDKKDICDKYNINFIALIDFSKCNFIKDIDICNIFSNILDNAIEACNKIPLDYREIILKGNIINNFYIIKAENTKINNILIRDNNILTDKKDTLKHGFGIKSIKNSVDKYDGTYLIEHNENRFTMIISIPMLSI
ncbi:sensor histidine kinase [Clostridioides sp. ES-S-0048-02]|uniref:ATP-binding protein n=1 Tax=Clostridioides sp. ES-S-0048-02 TaxID=2770777 RepID=UPI001D106D41|nr:GHKL domain-containing protein [Clostridioides sp. ES-S-0048-02]